jgi:hypothetical protein
VHAYLNNPTLKDEFLAEIGKHEAADALIKGTYVQMNSDFKGCAIGCALHSLNILQGKTGKAAAKNTNAHVRYEEELGLPTWFAYMEDHIFEHLPDELAKTWPRRLAEAIPVGAVVDDVVLAKILRWVLADTEFGVRFATDDAESRGYIDDVAAMFDLEIAGHASTEQREAAAARAAWDARAARDAWAASWAACAAWDAWAARAAWDAWAAGAAWDAWAARAARAAWDESMTAGSGTPDAPRKKAPEFFPALADYVIHVVRALPRGDLLRDQRHEEDRHA